MKTEYQQEIIHKIRQLRQDHNCSQYAIASLLGISPGQIGNIESFRTGHKYTLKHIKVICDEFNYPIDRIFISEEDYNSDTDIISLLITKIINYEES